MNSISSVSYSTQGDRILCVVDNRVVVYDAKTHKLLREKKGEDYDDHFSTAVFSPDGTYIAAAGLGDTIRVWNVQTGLIRYVFRGHTDTITSLSFSPFEKRIASGSRDRTVRVWKCNNNSTTHKTHSFQHHATVMSVSFFPDGQRLASTTLDGWLRIFDTKSNRVLYTCHAGPYMSISPNGQYIATGGSSKRCQIFGVANDVCLLYEIDSCVSMSSLAFSDDGKMLATSGTTHNAVYLWAIHKKTYKKVETLRHSSWVNVVKFSPNSECLIAASMDGRINLWKDTGRSFSDLSLSLTTTLRNLSPHVLSLVLEYVPKTSWYPQECHMK